MAGEYSLALITIEKKTECFFTVSQLNSRYAKWVDGQYTTSECSMLLGRIKDSSERDFSNFPIEFIDGICSDEEDVTVAPDFPLPPGEYMVFIMMDWRIPERYSTFEFRTYSELPVKIERCDEDDYPGILSNILKGYALNEINNRSKEIEEYTYIEKGDKDISWYLFLKNPPAKFRFAFYENNSKIGSNLFEFVSSDLYNIIEPDPDGDRQTVIKVEPQQNAIIVFGKAEGEAIDIDRKDDHLQVTVKWHF